MTEKEQFIVLLDHQPVRPADAIVVLEGDGLARIPHTCHLFLSGFAPQIVYSGGLDNPDGGCFVFDRTREEFEKQGVDPGMVRVEASSRHTREQAVRIIETGQAEGWKRIILVATHYHHYRAFMTFLHEILRTGAPIDLRSSPARDVPWLARNPWGVRFELLEDEFSKISQYQAKGDVCSFADAISYLKWQETQV
jgi:uncharacterized SAM-binding protein YcdF (DUF218 family)